MGVAHNLCPVLNARFDQRVFIFEVVFSQGDLVSFQVSGVKHDMNRISARSLKYFGSMPELV